jgi:excisionase family DNA binding protein
VDLKTAANRLDVHYQTAYRWVRRGNLQAMKLDGRYEVTEAEVRRVQAHRRAPKPAPPVARVRAWQPIVARLVDDLLTGDELRARVAIERLHLDGIHCVDICQSLLVPALEEVGARWQAGTVSVAEEHRASAICERALARISDHPRGRPRGVALVLTPPGESHHLPALMATLALRADRWRVHHLGTDVPGDDVLALAARLSPRLVVLSTTLTAMADEARTFGTRFDGSHVLVGGPGRSLEELLAAARLAP